MNTIAKATMLTSALLLTGLSVQAEITSAKTMKEVKSTIEELLKTQKPEEFLVAFDIDDTMVQPNDPAVNYTALQKYQDEYKTILNDLTPEQKDLARVLTTQIIPQKLVEADTPKIIKDLQQKGIKVIAITTELAGKIKGSEEDLIIIRQGQLKKMGLDFSKGLKDFLTNATFSDFKKYAGSYPMFYKGILSTNGEGDATKGEVLVAMFKRIGSSTDGKTQKPEFEPKLIVLIDNNKKELADAEEQLKAYNPSIQFLGIEYEGAKTSAHQDISKEDFEKFWNNIANRAKL